MASDTLILTLDAVTEGREIMFPYPAGRTSSDYARSGATLTIGSTVYREGSGVFDLSYRERGVQLRWSGPAVAANSWTLLCPLDGPSLSASTSGSNVNNIETALTRTCRMMAWGHSFEAFGQERTTSGAGYVTKTSPIGSRFWLQAMMGPRFEAPYVTSGKYGGQNTTTMLANAAAVVADIRAQKINTVLFIGVCNDVIQDEAGYQLTKNNITAMAKIAVAEGCYFIVTTDVPAGGSFTRSAATLRGFGRMQHYLMYELPRLSPLIIPVDTYRYFTQPGNTDGTPTGFTGLYQSDLLHLGYRGKRAFAYPIYQVLDKLFPVAGDYSQSSLAFPYDATAGSPNKRGNILTNGMMTGSGGTASGASVSGTIPASWTLSGPASGLTVVGSVGTDADGTPYAQAAVSGTAGATAVSVVFRQDPSTSRFSQNDEHRGSAYLLLKKSDAATGYVNVRGVELRATPSTSSPSASWQGVCGDVVATTEALPTDLDWSQFNGGKGLYFRTPDQQKITGVYTGESPFARFECVLTFDAAAASDAVFQVRQALWNKSYADAPF